MSLRARKLAPAEADISGVTSQTSTAGLCSGNLPEVVKGLCSPAFRTAKSLRRLFLDEFVGTRRERRPQRRCNRRFAEGRAALREGLLRVRRRLGGSARRCPLACEQASNLLTKVLERGRSWRTWKSRPAMSHTTPVCRTGTTLLPQPRVLASPLGASMSATWTGCSTPTRSCCGSL